MIEVSVDLGTRSYPILIGNGLLADPSVIGAAIKARQVLIVSNDTVGPLYAERLAAHLSNRVVKTILLPDGEAYKNLASVDLIMTALLEARYERGCAIVALGGGVVGDIAGFAAASYQRGVGFCAGSNHLARTGRFIGGRQDWR